MVQRPLEVHFMPYFCAMTREAAAVLLLSSSARF
jgi:hypothetical protein